MPSNDNVVVARHLESLATATKNYILSSTSQNGGGSTTTTNVFAGATSNTGGASGIVPAPAAGDDDKFLCGNGEWVTIQSGGGSYPIATSLEAGLMSAEDKQHLDSVFQSSADFADAVLTGVGGKFLPSVSSVSDYMYFKDSNIQFFDSKLQRLCNEVSYKTNEVNLASGMSFLNGRTTLKATYDGLKCSLTSTLYDGAQPSLASNTSTYFYYRHLFKVSETKGFFEEAYHNENSSYYSKVNRQVFLVKDTGQVSLGANESIISGGSTSTEIDCNHVQSLENKNVFAIILVKETVSSGNESYSITGTAYYDDGKTTYTSMGTVSSIGTYYGSTPASKTDTSRFNGLITTFNKPKFTYSNGSITVTQGNKTRPNSSTFNNVFIGDEYDYNSSKDCTARRWYLWCIHGSGSSPCWSKNLVQSWVSGSGTTYNVTGFDINYDIIIHAYPDRTRTNWYLITFRKGTYSYSATWIDSCFKAWYFDPRTCDIQPCSKTLSQILPDLVI